MAFDAFRQRLGSLIGGFDAAQAHRRLRGFRASRAHVNTLIAASGDTITARARWLVRNNGYAANAVESFASNVVGDGIKPSSTIADAAKKEELQALWLAWTDDADAEGLTDFYGLQRRAAREVFLAGEVFVRLRPRRAEDGLSVPLQLQMLPAEMLPLDMNRTLPGAGVIRQGIEFDGIGRRVAYHFLRRHPGDMTDPGLAGETTRVPASEVIHVVDPVEAGQLRGVSRFTPAIVKLFTLDLYDDAELERKKIAAMFAMFITSPAPETPLDPTDEDLEVAPGQVVRLDPGEDVSTPASRSSIAHCCKSRRRWAFPTAISPMTPPRGTSPTPGSRWWISGAGCRRSSMGCWYSSCAARFGCAGWTPPCCRTRWICQTMTTSSDNIRPAPGCRQNGTGSTR